MLKLLFNNRIVPQKEWMTHFGSLRCKWRQFNRQSFSVAQDTFVFTLLEEHGLNAELGDFTPVFRVVHLRSDQSGQMVIIGLHGPYWHSCTSHISFSLDIS